MAVWTADTEYACGWTMDDDCAPNPDKIPDLDPEEGEPDAAAVAIFQRCVNTAADVLYALSGRQFGLCELTVRPCRTDCSDSASQSGFRWTPALVGGQWTNVSCGQQSCSLVCSCNSVCEVVLPGPIASVSEIKLDGVTLPNDGSAYRVDNRRSIVSLRKPSPIQGSVIVGFAGLDPSATVTFDQTPTSTEFAVDLGNNTYGPTNGIIRATFIGIDCVETTYEGPDDTGIVISRPSADQSITPEAWYWPAPGTVLTIGDEVLSTIHEEDEASVLATLVSGTGVTSNPNPPPLSRNITLSPGSTIRFCPTQPLLFCWPTCQNMSADSDSEDTWEVTYLRGNPLPEAGRTALAKLAFEICMACINDDCCELPRRVASLTRDGVTMAMLDPMTFINEGLTGLYEVDLWLRSVNPKARVRGATILSPDMPLTRRTTWQG